MTQATSSAEFNQLYRYSDHTLLLDASLIGQARSLRGALEHFEATCREAGFRLLVAHVAEWMAQHGASAKVIDDWVRIVGQGFQLADSSGFFHLVPGWLPPWMLDFVRSEPSSVLKPGNSRPVVGWLQFYWGFVLEGWYLPVWLLQIMHWPNVGGSNFGWVLPGEAAKSPSKPQDDAGRSTPLPEQTEKHVFLQGNLDSTVENDKDLLDKTRRYDIQGNSKQVVEHAYFKGRTQPILTVRDHIAAYGCLMTCFTMLLRDAGSKVRVTDLYRVNYSQQPDNRRANTTIDEDLASQDDSDAMQRDIAVFDLELKANTVSLTTGKTYASKTAKSVFSTTDRVAIEAKVKELLNDGPFIMQVSTGTAYGHWIIVDASKGGNKFSIRDPLRGEVVDAEIPSSKYIPTGDVYFLTESTAK